MSEPRSADPSLSRPLRVIGLLSMALLFFPLLSAFAGYGYGEQEDPLITGFTSVIAHGREGNWGGVGKDLEKLAGLVAEVKEKRGRDLSGEISAAAARKDLSELAGRLAVLTAEAIRIRLQSNLDEGFRSQGTARDRVKAARLYYDRLLAGNARKRNEKGHRQAVEALEAAFRAVGAPGFLGSGGTPPDVEAYRKAMASVSNTLAEVFGK